MDPSQGVAVCVDPHGTDLQHLDFDLVVHIQPVQSRSESGSMAPAVFRVQATLRVRASP
ncbi:MAG: hypothetical protein OXG36_11515 [Caldilineaceae bacterium]|nr:hypothetical protein [Caldilineaceae bacterium]